MIWKVVAVLVEVWIHIPVHIVKIILKTDIAALSIHLKCLFELQEIIKPSENVLLLFLYLTP
ncbi:hypothetical protein X975_17859, partial [Stegodyphus mimosarum]